MSAVAIFGGMVLRGLRGSPWWISAGCALHPLETLGSTTSGREGTFDPETFAIAYLGFDLMVAPYMAVTHGFGHLRDRRSSAA